MTDNKQASAQKAKLKSRTPTAKTAEDMYEEIVELKKNLSSMSEENTTLKAKLRRTEEDSVKKEKLMEKLVMENKKNDEKLKNVKNDRKPAPSVNVNALKQKIQQLEKLLKDKEAPKLNLSETRKRPEMRNGDNKNTQVPPGVVNGVETNARSAPPFRSPGLKSQADDTLKTLIQKVEEENKRLKQDLIRALVVNNGPMKVELEEHSKSTLIAMVTSLEKERDKLEKEMKTMNFSFDGNKPVERNDKYVEEIKHLQDAIENCKQDRFRYFNLAEDRENQIRNLQAEISELQNKMEELKKSKTSARPNATRPSAKQVNGTHKIAPTVQASNKPIQRALEVKATRKPIREGSQKSATSVRDQNKQTKNQLNEVKPPSATKARSTTATTKTTPNKTQTKVGTTPKTEPNKPKTEVENFAKNRAAKKIQNTWRSHSAEKKKPVGPGGDTARTVQENGAASETSKDKAARIIQNNWRTYNKKTRDEEKAMDEAVIQIQAASKGHLHRSEQINTMVEEINNMDDSFDDVVMPVKPKEPAAPLENKQPEPVHVHQAGMEEIDSDENDVIC